MRPSQLPESEIDVVREALLHYRGVWMWWLSARGTTDTERQLANMKLALIDKELARG
jgi:hypothetical protein